MGGHPLGPRKMSSHQNREDLAQALTPGAVDGEEIRNPCPRVVVGNKPPNSASFSSSVERMDYTWWLIKSFWGLTSCGSAPWETTPGPGDSVHHHSQESRTAGDASPRLPHTSC